MIESEFLGVRKLLILSAFWNLWSAGFESVSKPLWEKRSKSRAIFEILESGFYLYISDSVKNALFDFVIYNRHCGSCGKVYRSIVNGREEIYYTAMIYQTAVYHQA
jgi:hypothetical protein